MLVSHCWGPEFASLSLHVGFMVDKPVWVGFVRVSPIFPCHKFHSTICPHSSFTFHFTSFAPVMVHQAWSASILAIHGPSIKGFHHFSSLYLALCRTRVERLYISYGTRSQVAQAARHFSTSTGWTAQVRFWVVAVSISFFTPSCPDWPWSPTSIL